MLALIVLTLCGLLNAQQAVNATSAFAMQELPVQQQDPNSASAHSANETEVEFEGNKAFSVSELTGMMKRCQARYTTPEETSDPARVRDECLRRIRFFYTKHGYLRATFGEQQRRETERGLKIIVPVEEGARYRVGTIKVEGAKLFSPEQIIEMIGVKTGDIADGAAIGAGLFERLRKAYADKGYVQYEAEPEPDFKPIAVGETEGIVDFKISIDEGRLFILHAIKFDGNSLLTDEELRRDLPLREGDPFSRQLLEDSVKKLNESGLFEKAIDMERDVDFHQYRKDGSEVGKFENDNDGADTGNGSLAITFRVKEKKRK